MRLDLGFALLFLGSSLCGCGGLLSSDHSEPAPADAAPACPTDPPIIDSACATLSSCAYDRCPAFRATARCQSGRWALDSTSCSADVPCPSTKPREGSPCPERTPPSCEYGQKECGDVFGTVKYQCQMSKWRAVVPVTTCPTIVPRSGAPCDQCENQYGARCVSPCKDGEQYLYECSRETLTWTTTKSGCM